MRYNAGISDKPGLPILAASALMLLAPVLLHAGKVKMCADETCVVTVKREKLDCLIHRNKSKTLVLGFKMGVGFGAGVGPEVGFSRKAEMRWNRMSQELIRRYEELCDMHNKGLFSVAEFQKRYDRLDEHYEKAKALKAEVEDTTQDRAGKAFDDLDRETRRHQTQEGDAAKVKERIQKLTGDMDTLYQDVVGPEFVGRISPSLRNISGLIMSPHLSLGPHGGRRK